MGGYREGGGGTIISFTALFYGGRDVVKEVSHRPFTEMTGFISGSSCAFCSGHSHTRTDFSPNVSVCPIYLNPQMFHTSIHLLSALCNINP